MIDRKLAGQNMQEEYQERWLKGDPWDSEDPADNTFRSLKNARQFAFVRDRRYARALEIGCGNGNFTPLIAGVADQVLSLDIAAAAIERARACSAEAGVGNVEFRVANIVEFDLTAEGPWDLVVMIEMVYSLGWLYPFFDIAWLAEQIHIAASPGGRLLLANTYGGPRDWLLRPYLINTYRDLFRNVGFRLESEEVFGKGATEHELGVLISLFTRDAV